MTGQVLHPVDDHAVHHLEGGARHDPEVAEALDQHAERHAALEPGEGRAEAEVDAVAEGDVPVRAAPDVEPLGIRELGFVAVRRADPGDGRLAGPERLAADLSVFHHGPEHRLDRRAIAEHLLDRVGQEGGVRAKLVVDRGPIVEAEDCVREEVGRRLVPRDEEEHAEAEQVGLGELLALDLGRDQPADQVVAWLVALPLDHPEEISAISRCVPP